MRISDWSSDVCSSDLSAHYRSELEFSPDNLMAALTRLKRMVMAVEGLKSHSEGTEWQSNDRDSLIANLPPKLQPLLDQFDAALSDDLMVPRALPLIEEALSMKKVAVEDKLRLTAAMDMPLGVILMTITRADLRVRPKIGRAHV